MDVPDFGRKDMIRIAEQLEGNAVFLRDVLDFRHNGTGIGIDKNLESHEASPPEFAVSSSSFFCFVMLHGFPAAVNLCFTDTTLFIGKQKQCRRTQNIETSSCRKQRAGV